MVSHQAIKKEKNRYQSTGGPHPEHHFYFSISSLMGAGGFLRVKGVNDKSRKK
jgi:hypothetical protein